MEISEDLLQSIIDRLNAEGLLKSLNKVDLFYDEPKFFKYSAALNFSPKFSDGLKVTDISSSGSSFTSEKEALLKCLVEAMERLNVYFFYKKNVVFSSRNKLDKDSMMLSYFNEDDSLNYIPLGWINGHSLTDDKSVFIPAQLSYLNFGHTYKEPILNPYITTGAACGLNHESILLNGIYEVVERDAFMTIYLNKISVPRIDLDNITDPDIKSIIQSCERYKLDLYVFNITTDLDIPVFMSVIIDKTGYGPLVTVGLKSSFDIKKAIIGSIGEALSVRTWLRNEIYRKKTNDFHINPDSIRNLKRRGLYWTPQYMIENLDFLLKSLLIEKTIKTYSKDKKSELQELIDRLAKKGHEIFYTDITHDIFAKINFRIYWVIIPSLHPLYLDEQRKVIRKDRLKTVASYFGLRNYKINPIPHPFL